MLTEDLLSQLLLMCELVPGTEWSGIMELVRVEGDVADESTELVFKASHAIMMSIDTPGNTSFNWDDPILFDRAIASPEGTMQMNVHSHHDLGAFFSDTDMRELRAKGEESFYIMLVVDNGTEDGRMNKWVAKAAWATQETHTKQISSFFGFSSREVKETVTVINELDLQLCLDSDAELANRVDTLEGRVPKLFNSIGSDAFFDDFIDPIDVKQGRPFGSYIPRSIDA